MNAAKLEEIGEVQGRMATQLWPDGAVLKCLVCVHTEQISAQQAASCLRNGWPSHCDRTMVCERAPSTTECYELTAMGRAAIDPTEAA